LLAVKDLVVNFGGVRALRDVGLTVKESEFLGLIGPNGSGKTTLFNCITGDLRPDQGSVHLDGRDITTWPKYRRARSGIARTYQNVEVFPGLTVADNLRFAGEVRGERDAQEAETLVEFLELQRLADLPASHLSYGQLKLLSLGLALIGQPRILLLDEPMAAVNPRLVGLIADRLERLNRSGQTIVLVEHNVPVVVALCRRVVVLNLGQIIFDESPDRIREDERVVEAYLGAGWSRA